MNALKQVDVSRERRSTINHTARSREHILDLMQKRSQQTKVKNDKIDNGSKSELKITPFQFHSRRSSESSKEVEKKSYKKTELEKIIMTVLPAIEEIGEYIAMAGSKVYNHRRLHDHDADGSPFDSHDADGSPFDSNKSKAQTSHRKVVDFTTVPATKGIQKVPEQQSNEDSRMPSQNNIRLAEKHSNILDDSYEKLQRKNSGRLQANKESSFKKSKFNQMQK
jgi:hypothetical protein